jgi:uncharacterized protein YjdB
MLRSRRQRAQREPSAAGLCSILVAAAFLSSGCSGDGLEPGDGLVDTVVVMPSVATVTLGAIFTLQAEARDADDELITGRRAFWAAEDPSIALVSDNGRVTARRVGSVKVAASIEGKSGLATVTVTTIPVATVTVSPGNATLLVGENKTLAAVVRDASGSVLPNRPVAWTSSSPAVATINGAGQVVAVSAGSTIISAESEGRSGLAAVNVSAVPVASLRVSPANATLLTGQTAQLQAEALDNDQNVLPGRQVLWFTSNATIASVSPNGTVSALAAGTATITATSEGKTATARVDVTLPRQAAIAVSPASATIGVLESVQMSAQLRNANGQVDDDARFTWSSTDTRVATVSNKGKVTGRFPGTATIRATSGSITGTSTITVKVGG